MIFPAILLTALIGWSITNLLVNGSIFNPIRNYFLVKLPIFSKLLTCMQCSGFWVGIFLGVLSIHYGILYNILFYIVLEHATLISSLIGIFLYGVFNSGVSVLINSILVFLHSFNRNIDSGDI
jgi:hypothetical protein